MMSIEDRIRDSLQQRAEDVEPTPALWQEVDRRITRRRWRTVGVWSLAGVAAALAAVAIVPGLVGGAGPAVPEIVPGDTTSGGVVPDTVAVVEDGLVRLRDLTSGDLLRFDAAYETSEGRFEGAADTHAIAVRPGSTRTEYAVISVHGGDGVQPGLLQVVRSDAGGTLEDGLAVGASTASTTLPAYEADPSFVPSAVWAPDADLAAITVPADADGAIVALWTSPSVTPGSDTEPASLDLAETGIVIERGAQLLDWVGSTAPAGDGSTLYVRRPSGDVVALQVRADQAQGLEVVDSAPVTDGSGGDALEGPSLDVGTFDVASSHRIVGRPAQPLFSLIDADGAIQLGWSPRGGAVDVRVDLTEVVGADASDLWLDAKQDAALVGDGQRLWLVAHDGNGTFREPVEVSFAAPIGALFDVAREVVDAAPDDTTDATTDEPAEDPTAEAEPGTPDTDTGTSEPGTTPALAEPVLVGGIRDLRLLLPDGTSRVLYGFAVEGESRVIEVAVRPGSTADDLTAAVLTQAEGMWDLRELRVVAGQVTVAAEPFPPAYRPGAGTDPGAGFVVTGPIWSPDGASLAWLETGPGGATLRTIGWTEDGPGTGDTATDNASWALDTAPIGVTLHPAGWHALGTDGDTEVTALHLVGDEPADGYQQVLLHRQADGAWVLASDVDTVPGPDLPGATVAVGGVVDATPPSTSRPAAMARLSEQGVVLYRAPYGDGVAGTQLADDLLPGEGLPLLWLEPVGDGWLVGSRSMATTYLVTADGRIARLDDAASASTVR
jgi:hypothetical protein